MGKGAEKRQRAECVRAFRLRKDGMTNREIAALLVRPVDRVPKMVERGERFADDPAQQSETRRSET